MFSSKHKDMLFSNPLNHYNIACRRELKAIPGLKNAFANLLVETLLLFVLLPKNVSFFQMEIYENYNEKTYRQNFSKHFEWIDFNIELGKHLFVGSDRKAIVIAPSCISK